MLGAGRWTVRDAWGARWTFVLGTRATADERGRALRGHAARWAVERIFGRPRDTNWPTLIDLAAVAASDARHYTHDALKSLVEARVGRAGSLLLLSAQQVAPPERSSAATEAPGAMTETERRVVAAITSRGEVMADDEWQYRVVGVAAAAAPSRRDGFERVRVDEARTLVLRLGAQPSMTFSQRAAWKEAAELLVDPFSEPRGGGLVLLRRAIRPRFIVAASVPTTTPSALRAAAKQDITLKFLEVGTGRPIVGAALTLAGPDGNQSRVTTSSAGTVTLTALDPGQCTATSIVENATADASFVPGAAAVARPSEAGQPSPIHPAWLVEVDEHRVQSGETPASIARDVGVAWNQIARFNWNTTDPATLQDFFRDRVGCTRRTPDGKTYVFDDADDPGIILIPRPWTGAFAVGMTHTILLAPLRSVYISLENESGLPIPGAEYEAVFADGSVRHGRLGRSGVARLAKVPEGAFSVAYLDQQDLLARSLAVSTRRAFEQQGTGPLFFMLGQEQAVIDKAVSVYQQYCNDLSGRGLAADIDQIVTDAEARPPLVLLCALAGLPIEGTDGVTVQGNGAGGLDHG